MSLQQRAGAFYSLYLYLYLYTYIYTYIFIYMYIFFRGGDTVSTGTI